MEKRTFTEVWYRSSKTLWPGLAFTDIGTLVINENSVEFRGRQTTIKIANIQKASYRRQGIDLVNNWVKLEYDDGRKAFFADGTRLGWGGIFGGTKRIFKAIHHSKNY